MPNLDIDRTDIQDADGLIQAASSGLARWERRVSASADRIAEGLRHRKYVVLLSFTILYFAGTCFRASQKLFWFDELFTLHLSRLPNIGSLWGALTQGVDLNPPLVYILTHFSDALFGEGHIATRLPEIIGFWIFCLCLFRFVSKRTSVLAGVISMLFPMVTTAYFYAYEARPHGIVLGFGGVALVCWQASVRSRQRAWWLIGLFAALLCAILTHTYAILLVVPFASAEVVRLLSVRRVDWAVWLAIIAPLSGGLACLPLLWAAKAHIPGTIMPATLIAMVGSYTFHLAPALGVLCVGLILRFVFTFASAQLPRPRSAERALDLPESVALIAFVAMPFLSFMLAILTGAPYLARYSISAVAGFGCILGIVASRRRPVGLGVLLFLIAQIGISLLNFALTGDVIEPTTSIRLSTRSDVSRTYDVMEAIPDKTSPIVLFDDMEFASFMHYAPPELASRLVYAAWDFDVNGEGYIRLQQCCRAPGAVKRLSEFRAGGDTFVALCDARSLYRLDYFIRQGADVRLENVLPGSVLASVRFGHGQGGSAVIPLR